MRLEKLSQSGGAEESLTTNRRPHFSAKFRASRFQSSSVQLDSGDFGPGNNSIAARRTPTMMTGAQMTFSLLGICIMASRS
jgi:hypothetical protein